MKALTSLGYDQLTDEEVDELFAEADTDNNNVIDYRGIFLKWCSETIRSCAYGNFV